MLLAIFLVETKNDIAAKETIDHLGLNIDKLMAFRRKVIEGYLELLDSMNDDDIRLLILSLGKRDAKGAFIPFCFAVVQILEGLI